MNEARILVVEDDRKIRTLLRTALEEDGLDVEEAETGPAAMKIISVRQVDLVTLDIHLGAESGLDLAREIRHMSDVPIIMITGRNDVIDRVVGLEIGADDYITKPFHVREVLARIRAILRRTRPLPHRMGEPAHVDTRAALRFDGMTARPERLELVDRCGRPCELTSGDFKLLNVFLKRPNRVLSRDQLMNLTGGVDWSPLDRTVDNQVARLRKKIEKDPSRPQLIKTVRGIGYTFACDVERVQPGAPSKSA
ncbi:response regulator transcription factor [Aestuariivita sp.]|uniref:response regulator n=1 Tax=Aestuariivita sp. TaxID=1872407 RepID=UPI00216C819C|nr:response regulator transcription factor [Aestuariivita sp.]MCE8005952.1 response regulator transcription factor [Aestuariivita sp.]